MGTENFEFSQKLQIDKELNDDFSFVVFSDAMPKIKFGEIFTHDNYCWYKVKKFTKNDLTEVLYKEVAANRYHDIKVIKIGE